MKNIIKAVIGLLLIFVYHIPRIIYHFLSWSYAFVFNHEDNLTANPKIHLKRAKELLNGDNSKLLYSALELRFALERMTQQELLLANKVSNNAIKEYSPTKKVKALRRLDVRTRHPHKIYFVNRKTGERFEWGQYKPMDELRVSHIQGKLGDLLHPKDGLSLGISNDPWYIQTRRFLLETYDYLSSLHQDNTPFFSFEGIENFEILKVDEQI